VEPHPDLGVRASSQVDRQGHPIGIKLRKEEVKRSKEEPLEVIESKRENDLVRDLTERSQ
jgi:hypothetical protein